MKANLINKTIEMSKSEANKAGKINSAEFNELNTLRSMYPAFEIVIKTSSTKKKSDYKGLTYSYMEMYITAHDDENKSIMEEYKTLRGISDEAQEVLAESLSYKKIKEWFLNKYPAIAEFHEKRESLLKNKAA